jgi:hypothetical protein
MMVMEFINNYEKEENQKKQEEEPNLRGIVISLNPEEMKLRNGKAVNLQNPTPDSNESKFEYSVEIEKMITNKFSEFGVFKDFENLIKSANKFYNDNDEITTYDKLLQQDQKLRQIILSKMDMSVAKDATLRFQLEAAMISLVNEDIDTRVAVS